MSGRLNFNDELTRVVALLNRCDVPVHHLLVGALSDAFSTATVPEDETKRLKFGGLICALFVWHEFGDARFQDRGNKHEGHEDTVDAIRILGESIDHLDESWNRIKRLAKLNHRGETLNMATVFADELRKNTKADWDAIICNLLMDFDIARSFALSRGVATRPTGRPQTIHFAKLVKLLAELAMLCDIAPLTNKGNPTANFCRIVQCFNLLLPWSPEHGDIKAWSARIAAAYKINLEKYPPAWTFKGQTER